MTVPDEALEAAMRASYRRDGWNDEHTRKFMRRALAAAAPFIAAQALSDAAEELKGRRLIDKPFHEYYPEWLNKKADAYRRKHP